MFKRITQPICKNIECKNNDPQFPNHCKLFITVKSCLQADIRYPGVKKNMLVWLEKNSGPIALIIGTLILIFVALIGCWLKGYKIG